VRAYSAVFDFATAVVTVHHLRGALEVLPEWWGVTLATSRGGRTTLMRLREPEQNPSPSPRALASLLWKSEAEDILAATAHRGAFAASARHTAYEALAETLGWEELRARVTEAMRLREAWLPAYSPTTCGG
jgi:hypothetical protein